MSLDKVDQIVRERVFESGEMLINLQQFNETLCKLNIPQEHIVNVGGVASMLHACAVDGSNKRFFQWRGTHDLDFAITNIVGMNTVNRLLENSDIQIKESRSSHSIKDKWILEVELDTAKGFFPSGRLLQVDIYTPINSRGDIEINKRIVHAYPGKFLTEPVKVLTIGKEKYTVPSIIDCMILKIDVYPDLRDKDLIDLHSLLYSAEKSGIAPKELVNKLKGAYSVRGVTSPRWQTRIKPTLMSLWQPSNRPEIEFVPAASSPYLEEITTILKTS